MKKHVKSRHCSLVNQGWVPESGGRNFWNIIYNADSDAKQIRQNSTFKIKLLFEYGI